MGKVFLYTGPGVFEVLANVCRNPLEALKQFVENAADAIEQSGTAEGQIQIRLEYASPTNVDQQGPLKRISIRDNGAGMTREKMREMLRRIGDSEKINLALRGEQGIGLLAFGLLAGEVHLASSPREGYPSTCLVLKRSWLKTGAAEIVERCPAHQHNSRGTVAYLEGILPDIASQLTKERIKVYLGQQFSSDLRAGLFAMSISDNEEFEQIHPQHFRGVKVMSAPISLGHAASAFVELYVLPWEMTDAGTQLYGRKGALICSLSELDDFNSLPWTDRRLEGYVRCDRLKRTADKTAVVQDEVYRALVNGLKQLEPKVQQLILEVSTESLEKRFNIILSRTGRLIDKFLRYREKGLLASLAIAAQAPRGDGDGHGHKIQPVPQPAGAGVATAAPSMKTTRPPFIGLKSPPRERSEYRSWYDPKEGIICINREHAEFLLSQREDRRCLRYLFSIWAKETLLQEFGADAQKVADELVGVLAEAEPLLR